MKALTPEQTSKVTDLYTRRELIPLVKFHRELHNSSLFDAVAAIRGLKDGGIDSGNLLPLTKVIENFGGVAKSAREAICFAFDNFEKLGFKDPFAAIAAIKRNFYA